MIDRVRVSFGADVIDRKRIRSSMERATELDVSGLDFAGERERGTGSRTRTELGISGNTQVGRVRYPPSPRSTRA